MTSVDQLERLLEVQARDGALDRLRHRRETAPERAEAAALAREAAALATRLTELRARRDTLVAEERKLEAEATALQAKASEVEARLYSGEVSSPRELQAMQSDVEQLRKHQRAVESRELEVMEEREPADAEVGSAEEQGAAIAVRAADIHARLGALEAEVDAEIARELHERELLTAPIDPALVAEYERCRARARGAGIARLVGMTCQGCHLTIPSTEVELIRKAAGTSLAHCDNCGCILVP